MRTLDHKKRIKQRIELRKRPETGYNQAKLLDLCLAEGTTKRRLAKLV